jgi:hypothetical protein
MKTLKIYGASDDLIETSGIEGCGEFSAYSESDYLGSIMVTDGYFGIRIHVIYDSQWAFAVTNALNDEGLPDWPIRRSFAKDAPYSETLEIDVPDNAELIWREE